MSFRINVIRSFKQVKSDISEFKNYVFEWLTLIINNQKKLLQKVRELEDKIQMLENK